jgi:hypothetical protein
LGSLLLTGCFGSKEQEYIVKKPASQLYQIISSLELNGSALGSYADAANTITVKRVNNESVTYKFTSEEEQDGATIAFRFQPSTDGKATKVLVTYDIPAVSVGDGKSLGKSAGEYFVVPTLVRKAFKKDLKKLFKAIEKSKPHRQSARELNLAFHAVSLVTNPKKMRSLAESDSSRYAVLNNNFRDDGGRDYAGSSTNIDAASKGGWATDNARPMSDAKPMTDTDNTELSTW